MEHKSLAEGGVRIKFACMCVGPLPSVDALTLEALRELTAIMARLEAAGAAPVLPDGFVGGNAALRVGGALWVSRSGKRAGAAMRVPEDWALVEHFDTVSWSARYRAACSQVRPSSDTPLLWCATLRTGRAVVLHGHAIDGAGDAAALRCPISPVETMFSTREDLEALERLLCAQHALYIRKGHGWFALVRSLPEARLMCSGIERYLGRTRARL